MIDLTKPSDYKIMKKISLLGLGISKMYNFPFLLVIYVVISGNVFLFLSNIIMLPLAIIISFILFLSLIYLTFKLFRKYHKKIWEFEQKYYENLWKIEKK